MVSGKKEPPVSENTNAESISKKVAYNAPNKPNIVLIFTDDVGYEIPSYTGGESYKTPNIDALAASGTQFTNCHATPMCSPSRVELLTGKYNFRNYTRWGHMDMGEKTIANMLKNAGYATCIAGKWQLGGGEKAIKKFGFDQYRIWNPFTSGQNNDEGENSQYKNPAVYQDGNNLPASQTQGKYGEDLFRQYLFDFMQQNASKPFFALWTMNLAHQPFTPTPDDPEYNTWQNKGGPGDIKFFPSMIAYMDKQVGMLISKLKELNIAENTIVIFTSDNGTDRLIRSNYKGRTIEGGKHKTNVYGTHVPLIVAGPSVTSGKVSDVLVDLSDFLPTLADMANIQVPDYGKLDGVTFWDNATGQSGKDKEWSFFYFFPHPERQGSSFARWAQTTTYKKYDINAAFPPKNKGRFYNIARDPAELNPVKITPGSAEAKYYNLLDSVLNVMK